MRITRHPFRRDSSSAVQLPIYSSSDEQTANHHQQSLPILSLTPAPPPAYDVPSDAQNGVIVYPEEKDTTPNTNTTNVSGSEVVEIGGEAVTDAGGRTSAASNDPTVMVMLLEDYRRSRIYIRELEWKVALRKCLQRQFYKWYALAIIILALTALLSAKHEDVVEFLAPVTRRIRDWPGGFMIPFALLIVVSFPPLIGHEIIGIICGLVWGLGEGFAILAAGTFIGEICLWVAFKWLCTARAAKFEQHNKLYSTLTQLIREKSFMFVLVLRFSAVPGHITTAVSASAGANFWLYLLAAFLTLPKQLTIVYLGVAFGTHSLKSTIISWTTTIATLIGTVIAAIYIYYQMRLIMRRQPVLPTTLPELNIAMAEEAHRRRSLNPDQRDRDIQATTALQARRPWLFAQNSFTDLNSSGGNARSKRWTLPGPLDDEEMREWEAGLNEGARLHEAERDIPTFSSAFEGGGPVPGPGPSSALARKRISDEVEWKDSRTATPDVGPNTSLLNSTDIRNTISPPNTAVRPQGYYTPRGTMSLELTRPPISGREQADEADLYALSRGARRPDYGRMRGDSRAALLGRPEIDWERDSDRESEGGKGFRGIAAGKRREVSDGSTTRRRSADSVAHHSFQVNKD